MLAFLKGEFQREWVVRVAWPERVSTYRFGAEIGWGRGWICGASGCCRGDPGQTLYLISWEGFSAFWGLKMSLSCSSRCFSCSHVESLLQMKDNGHSLNTLQRSREGWAFTSS